MQTDCGGSISLDHLGVWVNVEHHMLYKPLGFISDWLHVQGVATPFYMLKGSSTPFYNGKG